MRESAIINLVTERLSYIPRLVDPLLRELVADTPAILIVGPRATGKTTSARRLARSVVSADRPEQAAALRAGPDAVLAALERPVLIDEWQLVPDTLAAVKRAVDMDWTPGSFILTGSAQSDALAAGWPATGRVVRVRQWGLTRRELEGEVDRPWFWDRLFSGDPPSPSLTRPAPTCAATSLARSPVAFRRSRGCRLTWRADGGSGRMWIKS